MSEERKRILTMLSEGKINAGEAEDLLNALDDGNTARSSSNKSARFLKIKVVEGGQDKINVNIPLSLAKMFMKFIPTDVKNKMDKNDVDIESIIQEIEDGAPAGKLVEVEDEEDRVEIFLD